MKNNLEKEIIPTYKIHMMEDEAFGGSPKGGVEKKNQEMESKSH